MIWGTVTHFKKSSEFSGVNLTLNKNRLNTNMKAITTILILVTFITSCNDRKGETDLVMFPGGMPNLTKDSNNNLHLVYGKGDSIMYSFSSDNGKTFSSPALVVVLPKLVAWATRGPQIAATAAGLVLTACNSSGNIFCYVKNEKDNWKQTQRVNDEDTTAKEALMALAANGQNAFAVWLDLRGDKHNKIYGAKSNDGGHTWSRNFLIYASPDSTVCECCKPSVVISGTDVFIMFRNWLNGNRDLYVIHSKDSGNSFDKAQKLGNGSWALNGCPMDGGGIAVDKSGKTQTVWNRKGIIYCCEPGNEEKKLGDGRNCSIEAINGKSIYAWVENGDVIVMKPNGNKENLGKGQLPLIKALNNENIICVWENNAQIYRAILEQ
jgi:hypothetical protein